MGDLFSLENRGQGGGSGPPGPPGPSGNPYREYTAVGAYAAGKVGQLSGSGITVASSCVGVDGLFGNTGAGGTTAQIYPSGSSCPVAGLPVGDLYLDVATGLAVLVGSLTPGNKTVRVGYSDGNKVLVQIGEEFTV